MPLLGGIIRHAISAERVAAVTTHKLRYAGPPKLASRDTFHPIVFLYVIGIILFYAPSALLSRDRFTQVHLGLCYESTSTSAVSSGHGHAAANR